MRKPTHVYQLNRLLKTGLIASICFLDVACINHNAQTRGIQNPSSALHIQVTTHLGDNANFVKGDELQLLLSLNRSSYCLLLYQDAQQHLWQLFPNRMRASAKLPAGDYQQFPNENDGIKITVGPPFGQEKVMLFASDKPLPDLPFVKSVNGMRLLRGTLASVEQQVSEQMNSQSAQLAQATSVINTAELP